MNLTIPLLQKAALIDNPGENASILVRSDVPVGTPGPHEVLVKITYTGVCGSEIRALSGWGSYNPVVGHEGVGTVVKLGDSVNDSMLGTTVGIKWLHSACGLCAACKAGFSNNCPDQVNTGRHVPGTLQQYAVADSRYITQLSDDLPGEVVAPLLCAGLTMAGAVCKLDDHLAPGDWVIVSGAGGGLGHMGVQIASRLKHLRVIAVDSGPAKRKLSLECGAEEFIDFITEQVEEKVKNLTGEGAAAIIVTAGSEAAFALAPSLVRNMGTIVSVGLPRNDFNIPIAASICSARALSFIGVAIGSEAQMRWLLHHVAQKTIYPSIKVVDFNDIETVFEDLKEQSVVGRVVVKMP
ncbi:hypothetical protein FZEAL_4054 [Fusarium zealandicum]|uniref:Enoyl reductase (ER) domain-containing protein n=1 Tax=Fusarium zealandicum TaxID=1053134 RepID=A0A8H4XL77_9HYPO|nr:hypothetical protein FZEAL_4054 [Fusarium zealandicum]